MVIVTPKEHVAEQEKLANPTGNLVSHLNRRRAGVDGGHYE